MLGEIIYFYSSFERMLFYISVATLVSKEGISFKAATFLMGNLMRINAKFGSDVLTRQLMRELIDTKPG